MSKLTDFRLLSFDVYGTLIDWDGGVLTALEPLLIKNNKQDLDRKHIIKTFVSIQSPLEKENPEKKYSEILTAAHPMLAEKLGCMEPSTEESKAFGDSVGKWPAFPDTVDALKRLQKHYKLVVLSNVDNSSFAASNAGPLQGFRFDAVLTAQDIGSYKPDLKNFEYMFEYVKREFGVERNEVLQTAQSQYHDHHPAKTLGLKSAWIFRPEAVMGNRESPVWNWKFDTLKDMAEAVERESKT